MTVLLSFLTLIRWRSIQTGGSLYSKPNPFWSKSNLLHRPPKTSRWVETIHWHPSMSKSTMYVFVIYVFFFFCQNTTSGFCIRVSSSSGNSKNDHLNIVCSVLVQLNLSFLIAVFFEFWGDSMERKWCTSLRCFIWQSGNIFSLVVAGG